MLSEVYPLLQEDRFKFPHSNLVGQVNPLFEDFINKYQKAISYEKQCKVQQNEFNVIFSQNENQTSQQQEDFTQLQKINESLQETNHSFQQDIKKKDSSINQLIKTQLQKDQEILDLQRELQIALDENRQFNIIAVEQIQNIKELKDSREQLITQLEKMTIDRNQLLETLQNYKMQMADSLNEINELHENIQIKQKILRDEEIRIGKMQKDLLNSGNYSKLAPEASEAQIARNINQDVPQIVARKLGKFHSAEIYDIAQNLNGSLIATCGGDRFVKVFDPLNLQSVSQFQAPGDEVYTSLCFSASSDLILLGSTDNNAQLWQVSGWKLKTKFLGHSDQVTAVDFVMGEKDICISGSKDRQLKLWNINNGSCVKSIPTGSMITAMKCQNNVPFVVTSHKDGSVRGYALKQDSKPTFSQKDLFDESVTSIIYNSDNNSVLLCSKEGSTIKLYDLRMNKVQQTFFHDKYMNSYDHNKACFGPNDKYIIAGNADSTILSWRSDNAQFHKQLAQGQHEGVVLCVAYHPVTGQMYSGDSRGNLVIWR